MSTILVNDGLRGSGTPFRFPEREDNLLYHYCSLDSFLKIVQSKKLWASELHFMNDLSEVRHFAQAAIVQAKQRLQENDDNEVLRQFINWAKDRAESGPLVFASSFSKNGSLLSQWRGYCPGGVGVSVGFATQDLQETAEKQGFSLKECRYSTTEAVQSAQDFINTILMSRDEPVEPDRYHPSQRYYGTFSTLEDTFLLQACAHKHDSFSEEAEVRLLSRVHHNYVEPPIKFRSTQTTIVPYLDFDLPTGPNGNLLVKNVFLGPSSMHNNTFHAINMFLAREGVTPIRIESSGIPLRT